MIISTYRRLNLPHIHPVGATYSILFLLHDAVPKPLLTALCTERNAVLERIRQRKFIGWKKAIAQTQREFDQRFDALLREHADQSHLLSNPKYARIVKARLQKYDGKLYDLYSYSVMSNHVHLEIDLSVQLPPDWDGCFVPPGYVDVPKIMQLIKGGSAYYINKERKMKGGSVWTSRYRDRFIRSENHLYSVWNYHLDNPVAAGLEAERWLHPFTGGMSLSEMDLRSGRRYYPDAGYLITQLFASDQEREKRAGSKRKA